MREGEVRCIFCAKGRDNIEHYVRECEELRVRCNKLGEEKRKIIDKLWGKELDDIKNKVIKKDKEKILRMRRDKKENTLSLKEIRIGRYADP
ncbi:hypothetical protein ALC56_07932 [Trachymyrmex septentrionalis]|uniref:Uncharacterized protein n=1 Tax=Trachymyrmex septentrionalis TaxID=34720 RepID=A0A195FBD8_9HYME|nr:hypothetical protein ALC56_07932 [Trachymyrmex septentrionalis]